MFPNASRFGIWNSEEAKTKARENRNNFSVHILTKNSLTESRITTEPQLLNRMLGRVLSMTWSVLNNNLDDMVSMVREPGLPNRSPTIVLFWTCNTFLIS